jgi:hypothetical protein
MTIFCRNETQKAPIWILSTLRGKKSIFWLLVGHVPYAVHNSTQKTTEDTFENLISKKYHWQKFPWGFLFQFDVEAKNPKQVDYSHIY